MSSPFKTFSCITYGCKVNFADSSTISRDLINLGYSQINKDELADIYIINTCSVTDMADRKAQKLIKKINIKSPDSKIIVTGCYAQLKPDEIVQIPGVDYVVGMNEKLDVKSYIFEKNEINVGEINNNFNISYSTNERTRAFLKIQDGCDYSCTYCTIPNARGVSRSDTVLNTIRKIKEILSNDVKEIVLSGINIGDFGVKQNESFNQLLMELEKVYNLYRYRISSIEPNLINNTMINIFKSSNKWVKHLHIPLQSGSNKILKSMKRRYSTSEYEEKIKKLKKMFPYICIGVDVIVGFPGESDEDFNETYNFIKKLDVSYLHVFTYSRRENTKADKFLTQVDDKVKKARRIILQKLSKYKYENFVNKNINNVREVLFENYENGLLSGLSDNYMKVFVPGNKSHINSIKKIRILNNDKFIFGEIIND